MKMLVVLALAALVAAEPEAEANADAELYRYGDFGDYQGPVSLMGIDKREADAETWKYAGRGKTYLSKGKGKGKGKGLVSGEAGGLREKREANAEPRKMGKRIGYKRYRYGGYGGYGFGR